jgi:hypothetical protein
MRHRFAEAALEVSNVDAIQHLCASQHERNSDYLEPFDPFELVDAEQPWEGCPRRIDSNGEISGHSGSLQPFCLQAWDRRSRDDAMVGECAAILCVSIT